MTHAKGLVSIFSQVKIWIKFPSLPISMSQLLLADGVEVRGPLHTPKKGNNFKCSLPMLEFYFT